jgi:hypothetical protein
MAIFNSYVSHYQRVFFPLDETQVPGQELIPSEHDEEVQRSFSMVLW